MINTVSQSASIATYLRYTTRTSNMQLKKSGNMKESMDSLKVLYLDFL